MSLMLTVYLVSSSHLLNYNNKDEGIKYFIDYTLEQSNYVVGCVNKND